MRLKRTEQDMFGRPASPAPAAADRRSRALRERPIPGGLVPFVPVIGLVVVLALILLLPVVGVTLLVVMVVGVLATIIRARYRQVKDIDYAELARQDPRRAMWQKYRGWRDGDTPPE